jgi:hypothetical protein
VVEVPIFDGGSMVTAPPEIVTLEDETPIVENAVPPALFALNVMLPVPLYTAGWLKVMIILDARATLVAPIAGLNVMGIGGTSSLVAVRTPTVILGVPDKPVALPVNAPTKLDAVIIPEVLMLPVLPIPTPVNPLPLPTKLDAVMIPVVFTLPLVPIPTPVSPEPLPTNDVAVMIPVVLIFPVLPIPTPVNPLPLPLKEVAVMIPTLKFDGGEILVENPTRLDALDILLLLFSYL